MAYFPATIFLQVQCCVIKSICSKYADLSEKKIGGGALYSFFATLSNGLVVNKNLITLNFTI